MRLAILLLPALFVLGCADASQDVASRPPANATPIEPTPASTPNECTCDDVVATLDIELALPLVTMRIAGSATYDPSSARWLIDDLDALEETVADIARVDDIVATIDATADACSLHCALEDGIDCRAACEGAILLVTHGSIASGAALDLGAELALDLVGAELMP